MFQNVFSKLHKQLINFLERYSWLDIKFLILTKVLFMTLFLFSMELQTSSKISQNKSSWNTYMPNRPLFFPFLCEIWM